jgi:hypothetical protein
MKVGTTMEAAHIHSPQRAAAVAQGCAQSRALHRRVMHACAHLGYWLGGGGICWLGGSSVHRLGGSGVHKGRHHSRYQLGSRGIGKGGHGGYQLGSGGIHKWGHPCGYWLGRGIVFEGGHPSS